MIHVHSPVKRGSIVNCGHQYAIHDMVVRGGENIAIMGTIEQGEEISSGIEIDLPSLIDLCKRVLLESGTLPKWFFFGVIVDAPRSQILTYFSPSKDKFFSDIYNDIKEHLAGDLPIADTETVVKNFFERNRDFYFNYKMIPHDSLFTGSSGATANPFDIRI